MRSEKIFGERAYVHNLFALLSVLAVLGYFIDQCLSGSWAAKGLFIFIFSFHMPLLFFWLARSLRVMRKIGERSSGWRFPL